MSWVDDLVAAEAALLARVRRDVDVVVSPRQHGPRAYRIVDDRPRGPRSIVSPVSYRQPVVPLDHAGIYRRYELLGTSAITFNSQPGAVVFFSVPLGVIWRVLSVHIVYACDATVNTRGVSLIILADAGSTLTAVTFLSQSNMSQTASQSARHVWMAGISPGSPPAANTAGSWGSGLGALPERCLLYEQARIGISPTFGGFGVADSVQSVEVYVEEWTTFAGTAR